jgi:hypothetical protein
MAEEASRRYDAALAAAAPAAAPATPPRFITSDLESVTGRYHTVTCLVRHPGAQPDGTRRRSPVHFLTSIHPPTYLCVVVIVIAIAIVIVLLLCCCVGRDDPLPAGEG